MNKLETYLINKECFEEYLSKKAEFKELEYKLKHDDSTNKKGYEKNLVQLKTECEDIEEFIETLYDSQLRRIFRMRYIDGMSLFTIGNKMYLDKSTVSRKINAFFKAAAHSKNAT